MQTGHDVFGADHPSPRASAGTEKRENAKSSNPPCCPHKNFSAEPSPTTNHHAPSSSQTKQDAPARAREIMDPQGLLIRQGWRGTGHSLDTSNRGIVKPLLISHKLDTLGLGKKRAAHTTDDQWWMRAFDESLRNIGTGKGAETTLSSIRAKGVKSGGLYGFFVKGEGLTGTIGVVGAEGAGKRKREDGGDADAKKRKKVEVKEDETVQTPLGPLTPSQTSILRSFIKRTEKSVRKLVKANEKKGVYGPYPSSSSSSSSSSGTCTPAATTPAEQSTSTARKAAKKARKQAAKLAFEELKKERIVDAVVQGEKIPNVKRWKTREDVVRNWDVVEQTVHLVMSSSPNDDKTATSTPPSTNTTTTSSTPSTKPPRKEKQKKSSRSEPEQGEAEISDLAVAAKLAKLSKEEREAYIVRARAKGVPLEVYVRRRIEKKTLEKR